MPKFLKNLFSKNIFEYLAEFSPENHKFIVIGFMVAVIVLFFFSFGTEFDADMHKINYMTVEQRAEMNKLIEQNKGKGKTFYVVAEGKTADEALVNYENMVLHHCESSLQSLEETKGFLLSENNMLCNVSGIGNFFPSKETQQKKINRWNDFWKDKKEIVENNVNKSAQNQGFNKNVFSGFSEILNKKYEIKEFDYFYENLQSMAENYFAIDTNKILIYTIVETDDIDLTAFNSSNPSMFIFDDTSITQKMVNALSEDFNKVLYICAFIVLLFLFFSFGRIEIAMLSFLPMAVGWVCILGLMNIFGLSFNIVNIILATFIFGQGDDYTIFVTEGLIYEYAYGKKMLAKFKTSIILSAAILFIAIGTLIFAEHPAMRSLAELTIVGMISVVSCAYLIPPLIYRWLVYVKDKKRLMPITLWNLAKTVYSFMIFLICSIIVTLVGFFILTIGGKTKKHKLLYHNILLNGFRILAKIIPQIKYKIHNPHGETFDKPVIIISNHQSYLDLLYMLLLSPKIIILMNKRVWNSPFYGWIIRYADFLPISDGLEQHVNRLQQFVDNGYSILVFPEGTRSPDGKIGRFHKGAFYLAQKFGLDILPVIIHGIGYVFPKQEFMMRKGRVDVEVCERQSLAYCHFDESQNPQNKQIIRGQVRNDSSLSLLEITKNFRKFYEKRYSEIVKKVETPDYFADLIMKNYIYKGAGIERAVRKSLKKHNYFAAEIEKLPESGEITIQNTGYGEFALMAALVRKSLKITAIERDEEKLEIARNCTSVPENLVFAKQY